MHYLNNNLVNPTHRIKIHLIGVGGTGSFILPEISAISKTLKELGRKELNITAYDDDIVEPHNCGRQKFFAPDVGGYKAEILVNRINRAMGSDLEYENEKYEFKVNNVPDIIISCVDNVKTRRDINKVFSKDKRSLNKFSYWIDCGNSKDYGQVIMGYRNTGKHHDRQPSLKSIMKLNPNIVDDENEPSCSLRASLSQQSFMVNKMTGVIAMEMLSALLFDYNINYNEAYFNLNPLSIKTNKI